MASPGATTPCDTPSDRRPALPHVVVAKARALRVIPISSQPRQVAMRPCAPAHNCCWSAQSTKHHLPILVVRGRVQRPPRTWEACGPQHGPQALRRTADGGRIRHTISSTPRRFRVEQLYSSTPTLLLLLPRGHASRRRRKANGRARCRRRASGRSRATVRPRSRPGDRAAVRGACRLRLRAVPAH
jgi:hypothetical protein